MEISRALSVRQFLVTLFFFLSISFSYLTHANWERINPGGGGAFNSVAIGPTGLVVSTSDLGGAYISEDDGNSWDSIGDLSHGLLMKHVQSVAFHPSDENIILLTGESTGSGNTGDSTGISRSTDKGQTFVPATFVNGPAAIIVPYQSTVVKSVAFAPSNGNIVYATARSNHDHVDSHIYKSTDAGLTFSLGADLTNTIDKPAIIKLAIHPTDPNTIIALSENDRFSNGQADNAILLSTNGGTSWTQVATNLDDMIDVVFHPTPDSNNINPVYISTYNPSNAVVTGHTGKTYYCADIESNPNSCALVHSQENHRGFLWPIAGDDQQIRTIDSTFSWYWGSSHPVAWRIFHNGSNWGSEVLAYNLDYTGSTSESWRAGWSRTHTVFGTIIGGETAKTLGYDLTYTNNDTIYWVTIQFAFKGIYSDSGTPTLDFLPAYTTENTAISDQWQSTGIDNITATLIDANDSDPDTIYVGLQDIGCWVSQDAGAFWKSCNFFHDYLNPLPNDWRGVDFSSGTNEYDVAFGGNVYALLSDPADPSNVWMSSSPSQKGDQAITYSSDYGQNWIIAANTPTGSSEVYGLSLDPTDTTHETLLVTIAGNVHRTTDGKNLSGSSWTDISSSSDCNGGCRATAVDSNGTYYAGGEEGLFYSTNNGSNWTEFSGSINGGFSSSSGDFHGFDWQGVTNIRPDETTAGVVFVSVFKNKDNNTDYKSGVYRCDINLATPSCTQLLGSSSSAMGATPYIRDVAVDPSNPNILYASSSRAYTGPEYSSSVKGMYRSTDGGSTWVNTKDAANDNNDNFEVGLSWSSAFPISISSADPNVVYIGSIGPGFYKRDFSIEYNNSEPTIDNPGSQSSVLGANVSLQISAIDTDGDVLSYSSTGLPDGLSINPSTGLISGSPLSISVSTVTISVSDGNNTASTSFSWVVSNNSTEIVAEYSADFTGPTPSNNWSYLWNSTGPIGSESNYTTLQWNNSGQYDSQGVFGPDSTEFNYGFLEATKAHPGKGQGAPDNAAYDRFAIAAFNVSQSGYYRIIESQASQSCSWTNDGVELMIYKENTLLFSEVITQSTNANFDNNIGFVNAGEDIYVAFGPNGSDGCDEVTDLDFKIERYEPEIVAEYSADFTGPTPSNNWSYLWNSTGPIGSEGNYTTLQWNNSGQYDSQGVFGPDSTEFNYGFLEATKAHPGKGQGAPDNAAYDRFAIAAFNVSQSGYYRIIESQASQSCSWTNDGVELMIYKENTLLFSEVITQSTNANFDNNIGFVNAGEDIYVAFGPNGSDGCDAVTDLDFKIERM